MGIYEFLLKKREKLERDLFPWKFQGGFFLPLNESEKTSALRLARMAIEKKIIFGDSDEVNDLSKRFQERVGVGVALWVNGKLRGSQIMMRKQLAQGITEAALYATRDERFKSIMPQEVSVLRIEITLFPLCGDRITRRDFIENHVDCTKGYRVSYRKRVGWYLPEVFNVVRFYKLKEFLESLIVNKAGVDKKFLKKALVENFPVDDFIESEDHTRACTLAGPVVETPIIQKYNDSFYERINRSIEAAIENLMFLQDQEGNISPVVHTLSGTRESVDVVRLAFVTTVLALYGTERKSFQATEAAKKGVVFIQKTLHFSKNDYTYALTLVYLSETFFFLNRFDEAKDIIQKLFSMKFPQEPILLLKAASVFLFFPEDVKCVEKSASLFEETFALFDSKRKMKEPVELAIFPEIIPVGLKLSEITNNKRYRTMALQVADWLVYQQLPDGGFPSMTGSCFAYTRGTGKIFEALALFPERYEENILRVWRWIERMQYSRENTYFVDSNHRIAILGGFRHDMFNQDVWIDASGHVILGGIRMLKQKIFR